MWDGACGVCLLYSCRRTAPVDTWKAPCECATKRQVYSKTTIGNNHSPTQIRKVVKQELRVQTRTQQCCGDESHQSMYYRTGERARNNIRPQTKYARSQRHPVSSVITTDLGTFRLPLATHHSSGIEVLAQRLIGTCTQMQLIKKSPQLLPPSKKWWPHHLTFFSWGWSSLRNSCNWLG